MEKNQNCEGKDMLVVRSDNGVKEIVIHFSNSAKNVLEKEAIETMLLDVLKEKSDKDDFISLDKDCFLMQENEQYIYLDANFSLLDSEESNNALFTFLDRIKDVVANGSTGHCIIEMYGPELTLINAADLAGTIEDTMEEALTQSRQKDIEPAIEFGINLSSEKTKANDDVLLVCFIGKI